MSPKYKVSWKSENPLMRGKWIESSVRFTEEEAIRFARPLFKQGVKIEEVKP